MNPTQVIAAIAFALGLSAGGTGAWQWQSSRVASIQLELKNEQLDRANERISLQRAARAVADRQTQTLAKAQIDAQARMVSLSADRDRARTDLDRLRLASETAVRNAASGLDACASTLATFNQLFTGCTARLVEVAGDADGILNQLILFQTAWPK